MRKEIKQRIFNKVTNHLLTQMKQAISDSHQCRYKTDDGFKCAVGCLISNESYSTEFEEKDFEQVYSMSEEFAGIMEHLCKVNSLSENDIDFFMSLQSLHDNNDPDHWEFCLKEFAKKHDLQFNWKGGRVRSNAISC